jgi:starch synthase
VRDPEHVAFLTAELAPLVKVGGLADVAGALPTALAARGVRTTVIIPAYREIDRARHGVRPLASGLEAPLGARTVRFDVYEAAAPARGVRWLLLDGGGFFDRDGIYVDPATKNEFPDTAERFAFFTRAALEALRRLGERIDAVHSHDHQTALAPFFLKHHYRDDPILGGAAAVYTLHNLGYQGAYPSASLELIGVGRDQFFPFGPFEHYGKVNWMKIGIWFADKVSTVSPRYAREICEDKVQGAGLEGVLAARREHLVGILNGIDTAIWNPAADPLIPAAYHREDFAGKRECKRVLVEECGLDSTGAFAGGFADREAPLVGLITRLVDQKGFDLIQKGFEELLGTGARFVVLGTGLEKYERFLQDAAREHPRRVAAVLRFDDRVAHRIEAGADMFLMPSLYEPCGLNQMYSLRYGTVPVVRETGGLADTVTDADACADGVGFTFREYTVEALVDALGRAVQAYRDPQRWRGIVARGMARDHSWAASAAQYVAMYRGAMEVHGR